MNDENTAALRAIPAYSELPYFECQDGWFRLLQELGWDLTLLAPNVRVVQVKNKFGLLRCYADAWDEETFKPVTDRLRQAERQSETVCELCGAFGLMRSGGWWQVRCDRCEVQWQTRPR